MNLETVSLTAVSEVCGSIQLYVSLASEGCKANLLLGANYLAYVTASFSGEALGLNVE